MRGPGRPFIVLEGVDGSGTTTQLEALRKTLEARGERVLATREPTGAAVGRFLRGALERRLVEPDGAPVELDWATMALLFAADRVDHVERTIRPALAAGCWVLCDRYDLSSLIYQSATSPEGAAALPWLRAINQRAVRPDLTVVLRVSPDTAAERRRRRGGPEELYERVELQRRLCGLYEDAAELVGADTLAFVDAEAPPEQVTQSILQLIDALP